MGAAYRWLNAGSKPTAGTITPEVVDAALMNLGLDLLHQYCFFDDEPVFFTGGEPKNIRLVETGAMVDAADQFDPNGKIGSYRVVKRYDNGN